MIDMFFWDTIRSTNIEESLSFFSSLPDKYLLSIIIIFILGLYSFWAYISHQNENENENENENNIKCIFLLIILLISGSKNIIINNINTLLKSSFFNKKEMNEVSKGMKYKYVENKEKLKILVIIGESETRNRMSLFGYNRKTTPKFDSDKEIIQYLRNTTNGINTQPNVTTLLTGLAGSDSININQTIFSILEIANYKTLTIDNNVFQNEDPLYKIKSSSDTYLNLNGLGETSSENDKKIRPDIVALDLLKKEYKINNNNEVYFLHLMGNHPPQKNRYPEEFNIFNSNYDNSVLYNDYIVSQAKNWFLEKNKENPTLVIYVSDHGVGLPPSKDGLYPPAIDNEAYGADDSLISNFNNPLILWVNNKFKEIRFVEYNNLINNKNKNIDNRFLFYSLSDLIGFKEINGINVSNYSIFSEKISFKLKYSNDEDTSIIISKIKN